MFFIYLHKKKLYTFEDPYKSPCCEKEIKATKNPTTQLPKNDLNKLGNTEVIEQMITETDDGNT